MGMSARNGDDDNTSIVKPKERFALKGEQERGRKLFFFEISLKCLNLET